MGQKALEAHVGFGSIANIAEREDIGRFKYVEEKDVDKAFDDLEKKLDTVLAKLIKEAGENDD